MHESVRIESHASLNSRSEWNGYKVARIIVEPSDKEAREKLNSIDQADKDEAERMAELKSRVDLVNCNKPVNSCRK